MAGNASRIAQGDELIERLLSPGRRVGILTVSAASLVPEHLRPPVFSVDSFFCWFHVGLAPRDFGPRGRGRSTPLATCR